MELRIYAQASLITKVNGEWYLNLNIFRVINFYTFG